MESSNQTKQSNSAAATALFLFFGIGFLAVAGFVSFTVAKEIFAPNTIKYLFLIIPWIFIFHFGSIGLLFIFLAFFGTSDPKKNATALAMKLGKKSLSQQWQEGVISDSNSEAFVWSIFSLIYRTLLVLPSLALGIYDYNSTNQPNVGLALVLIPLYSFGKILFARQRHQNFGRSICRIQKSFSTEAVKFQFESERGHEEITKYEVALRAEQRTLVRSNNKQHLRTTEILKLEKEILVPQKGSAQGRVSLELTIPEHATPSTNPDEKEGVFWLLSTKGIRPGVDFFAEFIVPINYSS